LLEAIILLNTKEYAQRYDAMIKAVSWLGYHPEEQMEDVLQKARRTPKYQEDEYYREWIDG